MNRLLKVYDTCRSLPAGKRLFSRLVCFKAPYFGTIKPLFQELRPGFCEITMKNRRAVHNHLKSVHAIAMCNICELAAGTLLEVTLPQKFRWIPKGMTVDYLKIARTDLKAQCRINETMDWDNKNELPMTVEVSDTNGVVVMRAVVSMYISPKKK